MASTGSKQSCQYTLTHISGVEAADIQMPGPAHYGADDPGLNNLKSSSALLVLNLAMPVFPSRSKHVVR